MMHSKLSLKRPLQAVPNSLVALLLLISLAGFADASYLTLEHFQNAIPPCSIGSCETVLASAYSSVFGIPLSLLGALYYLTVSVGLFAYLEGKSRGSGEIFLRSALSLTLLGFLMSLGLVSLMGLVIHAWCIYCLGSATSSTLLFLGAIFVFKRYSIPTI